MNEYSRVNWQDGTVLQNAKVTIDGVDYDVQPAVESGTTPLNATNLNKMDAGIKNASEDIITLNERKIEKTVIELLAVSDVAPEECESGDKYYNTIDEYIYTATGHNTWGSQGVLPVSTYLYADTTENKMYYYDGTEFKSYGGGGETIPAEIAVSTTQPTGEEKLWINPDETTDQARYKDGNTWKTLSIKALDSMPIGAIIQFMGSTIPNGWLVCDGSTLDDETYPELHEVIGGSGSTFTIPNFKGRVAVGYDSTDTDFNALGKTGGSKELQEHTHQEYCSTETINVQAGSSATCPKNYPYSNTGSTGTGDSGNLQPYLVVNYIIKAKNTTPTMASIVGTYSTSTKDGYSCDYVNKLNIPTLLKERNYASGWTDECTIPNDVKWIYIIVNGVSCENVLIPTTIAKTYTTATPYFIANQSGLTYQFAVDGNNVFKGLFRSEGGTNTSIKIYGIK